MAYRSPVVGFVLCVGLGVTAIAAAQPVAPPTIYRVTLQPDAAVLTITGTGLGPHLLVTVDGQPVTTLPGATEAQIEVVAPAVVLTTPGTYRLSVVDSVRRVGDAFVVASHGGVAGGVSEAAPLPAISAVGSASSAASRSGVANPAESASSTRSPNTPSEDLVARLTRLEAASARRR